MTSKFKLVNSFILGFIVVFSLNVYSKPLFLGDSLTYQVANSYKKISHLDVRYMSGSGLLSNKIINWGDYIQKINYSNYNAIYIVLGTNDFITENKKEFYQFKVINFIRKIRAYSDGKPIIWLLPPSLADQHKNHLLKNTRDAIVTACLHENVLTVDMRNALGMNYIEDFEGMSIRTKDGIHITEYGADRVVTLLFMSVG
ncbi:GDSL-type esterase/lipase family protein [Xenorhabdus bovienii]|uniref:DUF459 domain-containing protein n=1 Tax=Xenorhabdus bovienii TaxID=40576 RepID=UPI003DA34913